MKLKIIDLTKEYIDKAIDYFPKSYILDLKKKSSYKQSIVARFVISKLIEKNYKIKGYLPIIDKNGIPIFTNNIFWSISHKDDIIFIGVSEMIIGIDIEVFKDRDKSLLDTFNNDNYKKLGGKTWDNFYILWTIKESIVKKRGTTLEDISDIKILNIKDIEKSISEVLFKKEFQLEINGKEEKVIFGTMMALYYSVCL